MCEWTETNLMPELPSDWPAGPGTPWIFHDSTFGHRVAKQADQSGQDLNAPELLYASAIPEQSWRLGLVYPGLMAHILIYVQPWQQILLLPTEETTLDIITRIEHHGARLGPVCFAEKAS